MGSRRPDPPSSPTRTTSPFAGMYPREDESINVAAARALHPRLRVEPARRVAAAQQVVAGKGHLLAEEVEVVREAEVAA